jgi:hypothetical protein
MKRAVFVLLAACAADPPTPQAPVANQAQPAPQPQPDDRARARREADEAIRAAHEAEERIDQIARGLEALDQRVSDAVGQIANAQSDADRAAAKARLEQLQREKAEMAMRVREAKEAAEKAQRLKGDFDTTECLNNPLARGC